MAANRDHSLPTPGAPAWASAEASLTQFLEEHLATLGYELVAVEIVNHREKILRLFIDTLSETAEGVGIEDCVKVTHALDVPLEARPELDTIFKSAYDLEVSSPGVDRPLRKPSHFAEFAGEIARISTFRPLTADETQAPEYSAKNPKQKNFYGILRGFETETDSVLFGIIPEDGTQEIFKGKGKPSKKKANAAPRPEVLIRMPHSLISKAHLDPAVVMPAEGETP
jgi:ribosome maturation factor RimP